MMEVHDHTHTFALQQGQVFFGLVGAGPYFTVLFVQGLDIDLVGVRNARAHRPDRLTAGTHYGGQEDTRKEWKKYSVHRLLNSKKMKVQMVQFSL